MLRGPLVLAMLWSVSALAQGETVLRDAIARYEKGAYADSIAVLEPAVASGLFTGPKKVEALTWLAASQFALGSKQQLEQTLRVLFEADPDAKADADQFPPPFVEAFDAARARARARQAAPREAVSAVPVEPRKPTRALGAVLLGAGAVSAGVGAYFAWDSRQRVVQASHQGLGIDADAQLATARTPATLATALLIAGAVLAVASIFGFVWGP